MNLITLRGGDHAMAGTLTGLQAKPRIVMVDDHAVDVPPADHMLVVRNDDSPGVIGLVGTVLGEAGVNIADMDVGQSPDGVAALMVLALSHRGPRPGPGRAAGRRPHPGRSQPGLARYPSSPPARLVPPTAAVGGRL